MSHYRSKNKTLVFIILLLLVTNLAVLGYFLFYRKNVQSPKPRDFNTILQKEVGLNDKQIAQYNEIKKDHWQQAKAKMEQIIKIKNNLFDLSKQPNTPDSIVEKLADSIGLLQKDVEMHAYKHLLATRAIITPNQQAAYDSFMKRIINKGRMGTPRTASAERK